MDANLLFKTVDERALVKGMIDVRHEITDDTIPRAPAWHAASRSRVHQQPAGKCTLPMRGRTRHTLRFVYCPMVDPFRSLVKKVSVRTLPEQSLILGWFIITLPIWRQSIRYKSQLQSLGRK